ncbi:MAG TPA: class I SAM-dependent methyltransferase [Alphaproteobacteria bacterium]|jgi:hypothetical protein|nr:class I SAM-dependent methyltransferase [Alphaproteobacteria bacterium]
MHRFWTRYIKPIVETVAPSRIVEVGAEFGWNTERLLTYCRETGAHIDVVDPSPHPALHDVLARFGKEYTYHARKSLDVLPRLQPAELILLDGDHNWFTVYHELREIYLLAAKSRQPPPIVLFHDVAWPYARRDMYYNPDGIHVVDRHPYAYRGILPGQSELTDAGLNGHLANALHEGGPHNGVLTGVEDFRASCGVETSLYSLPFFNGLGILAPQARMTPALQAVIDGFYTADSLLETCRLLEKDGMSVRADMAAMKVQLTKRTDALGRARKRIEELEQALAAAEQSPAPEGRSR